MLKLVAKLIAGGGLVSLMSGCSTVVDLKYQGNSVAVGTYSTGKIRTGYFVDRRGEDPDYLGAIRAPVGAPTKRLRFRTSASDVVEQALADALKYRGWLSHSENARNCISAEILHFDCNQLIIKDAEITLRVTMGGPTCNGALWTAIFTSHKRNWLPTLVPGVAPTEGLRALAEATLRDVVNKIIYDYHFQSTLQAQDTVPPSRPTASRSHEATSHQGLGAGAVTAPRTRESYEEYVVAGECEGHAVTGTVSASPDSQTVNGMLKTDGGGEVSFTGKWVRKGEIEGSDESGRTCSLETY